MLSVAKEQGIDTNAAAVMMADAASLLPHPITGHRCALIFELLGCDGNDACIVRGSLIIQWLVANGWAMGANDPV